MGKPGYFFFASRWLPPPSPVQPNTTQTPMPCVARSAAASDDSGVAGGPDGGMGHLTLLTWSGSGQLVRHPPRLPHHHITLRSALHYITLHCAARHPHSRHASSRHHDDNDGGDTRRRTAMTGGASARPVGAGRQAAADGRPVTGGRIWLPYLFYRAGPGGGTVAAPLRCSAVRRYTGPVSPGGRKMAQHPSPDAQPRAKASGALPYRRHSSTTESDSTAGR